jgi:glucose-6-phosphate 1-dehydrogenase
MAANHPTKNQQGPVIVVFGITGDLSRRKLLPALYHLLRQDLLPENTQIVGISRRPLTTEELLSNVELCVLEKDKVCDPAGLAKVKASLSTAQLDPDSLEDFEKLAEQLDSFDTAAGKRRRIFYMSVPASAFTDIIEHLKMSGLNDERSNILVEKPFGYDLASAEQLLKVTATAFSEEQIYRIDHYLAKETAQNLLTFRKYNPIFVPIWTSEHIAKVHIRASEQIGIEGRAGFYEQTGALRDLIQSHLMQLLSITMMDAPQDMSSQSIHAAKQFFLQQLKPADPAKAVRAQYEGYRSEVENDSSMVETYAKVSLEHNSERWKGTEIILETGKGLAEKNTDIIIEFKQPHDARRNSLIFNIQPNEGITLDLMVKEPGFANHMHQVALDFRYKDYYDGEQVEAYERVFMDAVQGDQALFASDEEVTATWRVLQPVLDHWQSDDKDLLFYPLGAELPLSALQKVG